MTHLNPYLRAVRDHLRQVYQVPQVAFYDGGSHPRAEFTYAGHRQVLTLQRQSGHHKLGASTINMKLRDISKLLGEPPPRSPDRSRHKLENMMPTMEALIGPDAKRRVQEAIRPKTLVVGQLMMGQMALYRDIKGSFRIRFHPPAEVVPMLGAAAVNVTRVAPDSWRLAPKPGVNPRVRQDGAKYLIDGGSAAVLIEGLPGPFGVTPAEYRVSVDSDVLVRILLDQVQPVVERRKQESGTLTSPLPDPHVEPPPNPRVEPPPNPRVEPPPNQPRAVLSMIVAIERTTPYRLVKLADHKGWAWQAPLIKL